MTFENPENPPADLLPMPALVGDGPNGPTLATSEGGVIEYEIPTQEELDAVMDQLPPRPPTP